MVSTFIKFQYRHIYVNKLLLLNFSAVLTVHSKFYNGNIGLT